MYKIVVSFTTSPSRLYRVEPVIRSILDQDYSVHAIEINLPDKYKNKEDYVIPDFLSPDNPKKDPKVSVIRTGRDIGPSSKVIPTLIRYKDTLDVYVVSIDDDHIYPKNVVSTLVKGLHLYGPDKVYGIGGLDIFLAPMGVTMHSYDKTYKVSTLEGVFGVLYNPILYSDESEVIDIVSYYDTIMNCSECITSDDITISNYLAMKNISIIRLNFKHMNRRKLNSAFMNRGLTIKESDKDGNAIHMMPGGHSKRYFTALTYLKSQNLLKLTIKKGCKFK